MPAAIADLLTSVGGLDHERVEEVLKIRKETGQALDKILSE